MFDVVSWLDLSKSLLGLLSVRKLDLARGSCGFSIRLRSLKMLSTVS